MPRGIPKNKAANPDDVLAEAERVYDSAAEIRALRARVAELEADIGAPMVRGIDKPKSSGTVTVACKIPQGLRLQLQAPMYRKMPTGQGRENEYQDVEFMVFVGTPYYVFGPAVPAMGGVPNGYILPKAIEGGYALTEGIPAEFWEKWLEQNRLAPYVENKMIFAYDPASAKSAAREHGELTSGLEPLSQDQDAKGRMLDRRIPKPLTANVARIGYDAERDAERKGMPLPAE